LTLGLDVSDVIARLAIVKRRRGRAQRIVASESSAAIKDAAKKALSSAEATCRARGGAAGAGKRCPTIWRGAGRLAQGAPITRSPPAPPRRSPSSARRRARREADDRVFDRRARHRRRPDRRQAVARRARARLVGRLAGAQSRRARRLPRFGGLEAEVASAGIVRRFVWRIKSGDESKVADQVKGDFSKIAAADILQGARLGDGVSISVVRDTAKYVGMAVANLATMFDPEVWSLAAASPRRATSCWRQFARRRSAA
jgi:hypothetical protein